MIYVALLITLLPFFSCAMEKESPVVLWSIHEVLLRPSADDLWLPSCLSPKSLEKELIETLNNTKSYTNKKALEHPGSLPLAIKAWLLDLESGETMKSLARESINRWTQPILYQVAGAAFSPQKSASYLKPIKEVVALVQACQKKGAETVLASNWNSNSFKEVDTQHQTITNLFKKRFLSGAMQKLTMDPAFFEQIMDNLGKDRPYFYIDVTEGKESLNAAQRAGITPLEVSTGDSDQTKSSAIQDLLKNNNLI